MARLPLGYTLAFMVMPVVACAPVGPDYESPDMDAPSGWTVPLAGGLTEADLSPESLTPWWRELQDPVLSDLVERAVAANLDLQTARSQLRQARAERAQSEGALSPTLEASAGSYSTGFDASWEIDVFGGLRRASEAAGADAEAALEARRDVLVSVLAEVALNYSELRTFQAQLDIAARNLKNQEQTLDIVAAQVDEGSATEIALQQATSNAAATRAEIPTFAQGIVQAKNRLCVLVAKPPGSLDDLLDVVRALPVPPPQVAVGVPAETLRRRPDVRAAERRLAAETARVGVATAELYPKFALNGSIGSEASFGPQMRWTIFSAGRIRREIEIQSEAQQQALIDYEETILEALEEVENSIAAFAEEQVRLQALRESAAAAHEAGRLASTRYEAGMSPFLEVLDAGRTEFATENEVAASEGKLLSNLIRLYKSLGGDWESLEPQVE